jgi:hypothetical protein
VTACWSVSIVAAPRSDAPADSGTSATEAGGSMGGHRRLACPEQSGGRFWKWSRRPGGRRDWQGVMDGDGGRRMGPPSSKKS